MRNHDLILSSLTIKLIFNYKFNRVVNQQKLRIAGQVQQSILDKIFKNLNLHYVSEVLYLYHKPGNPVCSFIETETKTFFVAEKSKSLRRFELAVLYGETKNITGGF